MSLAVDPRATTDHWGFSSSASVKELLQHMIERMSDAEAHQLLEFAQHLQHGSDNLLTMKRLATNPAFKVPGEWSEGLSMSLRPSTARA